DLYLRKTASASSTPARLASGSMKGIIPEVDCETDSPAHLVRVPSKSGTIRPAGPSLVAQRSLFSPAAFHPSEKPHRYKANAALQEVQP
ncbi:MAG: hypothetical protein ACRD22_19590, partial [Terriglobia bacterium]